MAGIIGYTRVSTRKQGESGLGLDAQRAAIESYAKQRGEKVLTIYVEVESGKRADRPELAKALSHARRSKATLAVGKLDRLSRDPDFLGELMKANTDFIACDMPSANKLTVRIMAAVAEAEREAISQRTKVALAAAKERGVKLGSARPGHWEGKEDVRLAALAKARGFASTARAEAAAESYGDVAPMMLDMRKAGATLQEIAAKLNSEGQVTRRGKRWNHVQVMRVLSRHE